MKKSVLVVGASGLVGSECLKILHDDAFFDRIVVLVRKRLDDFKDDTRITQHQIDFDNLEQYRELIRADQVICALGTTIKKAGSHKNFYKVDFTYAYTIARMALANGAEHFLLVSSLGADPRSRVFYSRVKGELETVLQQLDYPCLSIFRPSLLLGERREFRLGEQLAKPFSFLFWGKYKPIQARTVARAMVHFAHQNLPGVRIVESDTMRKLENG